MTIVESSNDSLFVVSDVEISAYFSQDFSHVDLTDARHSVFQL